MLLGCSAAALLVMLTACGQKGPLFLPEESSTDQAPTAQPAGDQESPAKGDDEEQEDGARR